MNVLIALCVVEVTSPTKVCFVCDQMDETVGVSGSLYPNQMYDKSQEHASMNSLWIKPLSLPCYGSKDGLF